MFERISFNVALILHVFISSAVIAAESLDDPMKPPGMTGVVSKKAGKPAWNLTSTLISGGRRVAMINNRLVSVGDKVSGARVMSISGDSVGLMIDGKAVRIKLSTKSLRKKPKRVN